jgi:FkbM family methyltransferase
MITSTKKFFSNLFFKFYYGFQGVPFTIDRETIRLDESLRRWNLTAEAAVHDIIGQNLQPDDVFIDVGANFGLHTVYAAKLVGAKGRVFAFEPVTKHLNLLQKNLSLSHVRERVEIVSAAVSNSTESSLTFYLPPEEEIAVTASLNADNDNLQKIEVANTRLDDYWNQIDREVKLIKIDVEGAELEVLRGAEKLLKRWKPKLLIEVHGFALPSFGTSVNELRNFLGNLGYQEHRLESENFRDEEYFQALYS